MSRLVILRNFRRGLLNLRRSRGMISGVAALAGVLFITQVFLALGIGIRHVRDQSMTRHAFAVVLQRGVPDRDVQQFLVSARQLSSVSAVEFITREKAMDLERKAHPGITALLEVDALNPYRDTAVITLAGLAAFDDFSAFVQHSRWGHTVDPAAFSAVAKQGEEWQAELNRLQMWNSITFLLFGAAGVILLLIVLELTRRSVMARKQDLFVERMAGAEEMSITLPFAAEAATTLCVALVLSFGCLLLIAYALPAVIPLSAEAASLVMTNGPSIFVMGLIAVLFLGSIGAVLGVRPSIRSALHAELLGMTS